VTSLLDRVVETPDDLLTLPLLPVLLVPSVQVLAQSLSSDGHDVSVDQVQLLEVREDAYRLRSTQSTAQRSAIDLESFGRAEAR
jgi:hypothetical protein